MQQRLRIDNYDLSAICGRFIVQVDDDDFRNSLIHDKKIDPFFIEKRVSQVVLVEETGKGRYVLAGVYYPHSGLLTAKGLVAKINDDVMYPDRHYRLMSPDEVKCVAEYLARETNKHADSQRDEAERKEMQNGKV